MGQIVRRKRKGRPSKTDPARRNSSTAPPSPVDRRRSRRRRNVRYNFDIDDYVDDDEFYEEEDEDVRRREKKLRLLLCEDDSRSNRRVGHGPASSSSDDFDEDDDGKPSKKRKLDGVDGEDDQDKEIEEMRGRKVEEEDEEAGGNAFVHGKASDLRNGVPLPDKKTLELILDKLQKKDIYGVYAEPVDPEELPDYHDVIKHPMDFATVRKKLAKGMYLTLEHFESDVLLICSNAMQYNAPDTIYYKQASSIQEQAKLRFQRLRANVGRSEIELKSEQKTTPSLSVPKKQLKKSVVRTVQDQVGSETFCGAIAKTGEFPNGSFAQTPVKPDSGEGLNAENSSLADNNQDKGEELLPGKGFVSKLGRKPSAHDENRRATYSISVQPVTRSESVFSTFEGESKQFIPVGLHVDHSYARSLARFAATLGSVAWKVASQTIEQALPEGVEFGHGWVGEYEPLPTPVLTPENCTSKESNFLAYFQITTDMRNDEKASKIADSGNEKAPKNPADSKEPNKSGCDSRKSPVFGTATGGKGTRVHVKQESPREASKDMRPFFSSLRVNASRFAGPNLKHQNSPSRNFTGPEKVSPRQVELNHPPVAHATAANFVATRQISSSSDAPSSRPATQNRDLVSSASFKRLNSNNDGFVSGRPSKGKPTPALLDCYSMVPMDNNLPCRQEGKPISVGLDCNRMVPTDNNLPYRQERQGLSDPVQMMKMLAEKAQHQHNNSNAGYLVGPKREDLDNAVSAVPQLKAQHHQIYSNGSTIGPKREDSNNVAITAAQAWMSLGAAGGFMKPPLAENANTQKQQISADSLYNPAGDCQQPQVSRFRGEFAVPGVRFQLDKNSYQQPAHAFVPQPVRMINESQLQNRHAGFPQLVTADLSRFQVQSGWRGVAPQMQQQSRPKQQDSRPPDLNIGYQSMGSPVRHSTGMHVDSQQPDLALQL